MENIPSSGENLMTVGLVSHIPDNLIIGGIEYVVKGHSQFNHTQAGTKMPGVGRNNLDDILTQLGT
jgi:hypothetical protein